MFIRNYLSKQKGAYLKHLRSKYKNALLERLPESPSIISNNCLAGFIYQDIGLPYLSPTAGLYFFFPDYINFLSDLENNLKSDIEFVNESKYTLGNERYTASKHKYPIGLLGGKHEIHFLHYKNSVDAEDKWKRRLDRFDLSKLVVLGTELDLCNNKDIENFNSLPFDNKCFLTRSKTDFSSAHHVKEFSKNPNIGDPYRYGHVLYANLIDKLSAK